MIHKLKIIAACAILAAPCYGHADGTQPANEAAGDLSLVPTMARPLYVAPTTGEQAGQSGQTTKFLDGLHLQQGATAAAASPLMTPFQGLSAKGERQGDVAIEKDRAAVLRFMGLDPAQRKGQLYYFVSLSMPQALLKEYALDAMWSGGRLILRGMDPAMPDLRTFIAEELQPLVQFKGGAAEISIDPRLYDTYQISMVPTIVYSQLPEDQLCLQEKQVSMQTPDGKTRSYGTCTNQADPTKYWKLEGSVSTTYALQAFQQAGAPVGYLQDAMKKAIQAGAPINPDEGKAAAGFSGDWQKVVTPSEIMTIESSVQGINGIGGAGKQQAYVFPTGPKSFGLAVGPEGLAAETPDHHQALVPVGQMLQKTAQPAAEQ